MLGFKVPPSSKKELSGFTSGISQFALKMTAATAIVYGTIKAVQALAKPFYMAADVARQGEEYLRLSKVLGISIENLQKFKYAAELSEVSFENLTQGIRLFSRKFADAQLGEKGALIDLKKLFDGKAIKGFKSTEEAMLAISDKFKEIPDGAKKTGIAMDLFGRAGANMIPFLNAGSQTIKELGLEFEDLGGVITGDMAKAGDELGDSMLRLRMMLTGVKIAIAKELLPIQIEMAKEFGKFFKENRKEIINAITVSVKVLGKVIFGIFRFLIWAAKTSAPGLRAIQIAFGAIGQSIKKMVGAGKESVDVWGLLGFVVGDLVSKFLKLVAVIGLAIGFWPALAEDISNAITGEGDSMIGDALSILWNTIKKWYYDLKKEFFESELVQKWMKRFHEFKKELTTWFEETKKLLQGNFDIISDAWSKMIDKMEKRWNDFKSAITGSIKNPFGLFGPNGLPDWVVNPGTHPMNGKQGGPTATNQPINVISNVTVNATTGANPQQIADETARVVKREFEKELRVAFRSVTAGAYA